MVHALCALENVVLDGVVEGGFEWIDLLRKLIWADASLVRATFRERAKQGTILRKLPLSPTLSPRGGEMPNLIQRYGHHLARLPLP